MASEPGNLPCSAGTTWSIFDHENFYQANETAKDEFAFETTVAE